MYDNGSYFANNLHALALAEWSLTKDLGRQHRFELRVCSALTRIFDVEKQLAPWCIFTWHPLWYVSNIMQHISIHQRVKGSELSEQASKIRKMEQVAIDYHFDCHSV